MASNTSNNDNYENIYHNRSNYYHLTFKIVLLFSIIWLNLEEFNLGQTKIPYISGQRVAQEHKKSHTGTRSRFRDYPAKLVESRNIFWYVLIFLRVSSKSINALH